MWPPEKWTLLAIQGMDRSTSGFRGDVSNRILECTMLYCKLILTFRQKTMMSPSCGSPETGKNVITSWAVTLQDWAGQARVPTRPLKSLHAAFSSCWNTTKLHQSALYLWPCHRLLSEGLVAERDKRHCLAIVWKNDEDHTQASNWSKQPSNWSLAWFQNKTEPSRTP